MAGPRCDRGSIACLRSTEIVFVSLILCYLVEVLKHARQHRHLLPPLPCNIIVEDIILIALWMEYVVASERTEALVKVLRLNVLQLRLVLLANFILFFKFHA